MCPLERRGTCAGRPDTDPRHQPHRPRPTWRWPTSWPPRSRTSWRSRSWWTGWPPTEVPQPGGGRRGRLVRLDLQGRVLEVNPYTARLLQIPFGEAPLPQDLWGSKDNHHRFVERIHAKSDVNGFDCRTLSRDGRILELQFSGRLLRRAGHHRRCGERSHAPEAQRAEAATGWASWRTSSARTPRHCWW